MISAQPGHMIDKHISSQINRDLTNSNVLVIYGGNNFDPLVFDENVHNKMVQEVILYFQKILEFCQNSSNSEIAICSLIPRPRYPHLEKYFKQTSLGLFQLCKKYKCATFIDCESMFYNIEGQILKHYFKNDFIHLNGVSSQMLARHVFNTITQK